MIQPPTPTSGRTPSFATVLYEIDGAILTLTLNRPEKLNALSQELVTDLMAALDAAEADPGIRVIIIKGAGRAFSAGHDISPGAHAPSDLSIAQDRERLQMMLMRLMRVWDCPKPVIAQVHGFCIAVGTLLPLFCDLTVVSAECRIRWPSLPIGGGMIGTLWTWLIGPKKAKEMSFIAGSEMSGTDAHFWGWANYAVPEAELEAKTRHLAAQIAKTPSDLLRMKKLAVNRVMELQGFRTAALAGAEWDALTHYTPGVLGIRAKIRELGLKGAISWFDKNGAA